MKRMVIFDFDGVIADSYWLALKVSQRKFPTITEEEHLNGFEGNIVIWEKGLTHPKTDIDFNAEIQREMHLVEFFEVEEAIASLAKKHRLSIVSSGLSATIRAYLEREAMLGFFPDILGFDVHASKHEKILSLMKKYELMPKDCVMVTDTSGDVREASMAGVDSIVVSWGFHNMERLSKVPHYRMIHKPSELEPAITEYFAR